MGGTLLMLQVIPAACCGRFRTAYSHAFCRLQPDSKRFPFATASHPSLLCFPCSCLTQNLQPMAAYMDGHALLEIVVPALLPLDPAATPEVCFLDCGCSSWPRTQSWAVVLVCLSLGRSRHSFHGLV